MFKSERSIPPVNVLESQQHLTQTHQTCGVHSFGSHQTAEEMSSKQDSSSSRGADNVDRDQPASSSDRGADNVDRDQPASSSDSGVCSHQTAKETSSKQDSSSLSSIRNDFLLHDAVKDKESYLIKMNEAVLKHRHSELKLKNLEQFQFTVGSLEDTSYDGAALEEWEQFYLPDHMFMRVFGLIKNFPSNSHIDELVFMVCEDKKIYAYEDARLHLVAKNMKKFFQQGVKFPGKKQYYHGQSFEDMTEDEWKKAKNSKEFSEVTKKHKEMLEDIKPSYLKNLEIIKQMQLAGLPRLDAGGGKKGPNQFPVYEIRSRQVLHMKTYVVSETDT